MKRGASGLLLPALVGWVAALVATAAPAAAAPAALVASTVSIASVLLLRRRPALRRTVVASGAVVALVALAVLLALPQRRPAGLPLDRPVEVRVAVSTATAVAGTGGGAARSVVHGDLVAVDGLSGGVRVPAVLFADGSRTPASGAVVRARVVLRAAPATDEAAVIGSVRGALRTVGAPGPVDAVADALRARFLSVTARLPGDGGALLPGLAIGDTSRVAPDLRQAMQDASLTHLTAVSGANCAVVIVVVLALAARLRLPRALRLLLAGAALGGFVVLVGPQPSVLRAATMAAVGLGCVLAGRRAAAAPLLGLAVVILLLLDPWTAWSAGFVLSAAATAGLLLLAPPLAERLGRRMPPRLALLLAVPIAAQVACQPVLVLLQPGIPVFGVLANLLAEPVVPAATVLGLTACLVAPVLPPVAAGVALLAWLPTAWIALVARVCGGLPQLGWPAGVGGAVLAALLLAVLLVAGRRRSAPRLRIAAVLLLATAALVVGGAAIGTAIGRSAGLPRDWVLAACDVGQGDGLVLRSAGRVAVVDTGREPQPVAACLRRLGVDRIDLLVLTHWDADHVGAAASLASRVRTALVGPVDGTPAVRLRQRLAQAGAHVVQARRGDAVRLGALRLDVLWPPDPLGGVEPGNDASVTLAVSGPITVLMTGDLGEQAQDALLAAGPLPRVAVMKVAHHGSADQSPAFYAAAGARVGIVSVGADNDYGHPTRRLLGILRATGEQPVRTDQDGMVLVSVREGRLVLWTEHPVTAAVWTPAK